MWHYLELPHSVGKLFSEFINHRGNLIRFVHNLHVKLGMSRRKNKRLFFTNLWHELEENVVVLGGFESSVTDSKLQCVQCLYEEGGVSPGRREREER